MFLSFLFKRKSDITGRWVQDMSDPSMAAGGFVLRPGGSACSLDSASPQYTGWHRSGNTLTLWGRAGKTDFIETMRIKKTGPDTMVLGNSDQLREFWRAGDK